MASVLDIGLLKFLLPVFSFILIWVISYAILVKTKILGESKGMNAFAAFAVAIIFLFTPEASDLIRMTLPWFIVVIIFVAVVFMMFMFLGVKEDKMAAVLEYPTVMWSLIIICVAIIVFALAQIFGSPIQAIYAGDGGEAGLMGDIGKIVFHPKVLGAVILLLIASQAIRLLLWHPPK